MRAEAEEGTAAQAATVVGATRVVGAEEGASDRDRCSAVRAQAANTLMNLSSCCQPCIEFSPRFFHYKNVSVTVIVLLLFLLLLVVVAVAFVVRFCFSFASHLLRQRALSAQILCCSAYLPLTLSLSLSASPSLLLLVSSCLPVPVPVSLSRLLLFVNFLLLATISLALL